MMALFDVEQIQAEIVRAVWILAWKALKDAESRYLLA